MPLKPLFTVAVLLCCLLTSGASAQLRLTDDERVDLASGFIGKSLLMDIVSRDCSVRFADPPYDGEGAVAKLHPYLRQDERQLFWQYLQSNDYADNVHHSESAFRESLENAIAKGITRLKACENFARSFLAEYEKTRADLERLR